MIPTDSRSRTWHLSGQNLNVVHSIMESTMRTFERMLAFAIMLAPIVMLSGCASSFMEIRKGSDRVAVAEPGQVARCVPIGKTTVSVLAQVGFFSRSVDAVDANLLQLARNDAVDEGGDTVVPGERPAYGKRTFAIYKCRP
jgi:hypothetical protein